MTGTVTAIEHGAWKSGDKATLKLTVSLTYYQYKQNNVPLHEIDIPNFKRVINGVDQLAAQRAALGF
jgi:P2 family phage contractile tail tube protein